MVTVFGSMQRENLTAEKQMKTQNRFMDCINCIFTLILAFTCCLSIASARVGETIDQCDARYGNVIFKLQKGDFNYRTYLSQNKKIKCIFKDKISAWEIIDIGPLRIPRNQFAGFMAKEALPFYRGILQNAYGLSREETDKLGLELQQLGEDAMDQTIVTDKLKASFEVRLLQKSDFYLEGKFRLHVIAMKELGDPLADFMAEAMMAEIRAGDIQRANGF